MAKFIVTVYEFDNDDLKYGKSKEIDIPDIDDSDEILSAELSKPIDQQKGKFKREFKVIARKKKP